MLRTTITLLASVSLAQAVNFTFTNANASGSNQFTDVSGSVISGGTVNVFFRSVTSTGIDDDFSTFDSISALSSYIASDFVSLGSGSITNFFQADNDLGGGLIIPGFDYEGFSITSQDISDGDGASLGEDQNPYLSIIFGDEAFIYRFNDILDPLAIPVDDTYTLGGSDDLGQILVGGIGPNASTGTSTTASTFQLQQIPEPSSVALLGLGSLALLARRKR